MKGRHYQEQPDGMPDDVWQEVLDCKRCGARTRKGGWCSKKPYLKKPDRSGPGPYRCELHGGAAYASAGVPGNKGNRKHGIYSKALTDEEKELWDEIPVASVDAEIKLTKIRLMRAVKLELSQEEALAEDPDTDEGMYVSKKATKNVGGLTERTVERQRTNYAAIVNQLVNQLARLIAQKVALEAGEEDPTDEYGAKIRELVASARRGDTTHGALRFSLEAMGVGDADRN